jgi:hypothetical protein
LERATVTLETERAKSPNPGYLWWWWWKEMKLGFGLLTEGPHQALQSVIILCVLMSTSFLNLNTYCCTGTSTMWFFGVVSSGVWFTVSAIW